MSCGERTVQELIEELEAMQRRVAELEASELRSRESMRLLSQAMESYQALFLDSPDLILVVAADTGEILACNHVISRFLCYPPDLVVGKHFSILFPSESRAGRRELLKEIHTHGAVFEAQQLVLGDGSQIPMDLTATPISWAGRSAVMATFRDVRDREHARSALLESGARFRALFESMNDAVTMFTVEKDGSEFVLMDLNAAAEEMYRVSKTEVLGKSLRELLPGSVDPDLRAVFRRVWTTGNTEHYPARRYEADGKEIWLEGFVHKLPSGEIVAVFSDRTEAQQADERIKESLREKEVLLREIHHRVKNDLQIVSSLLDLQCDYIREPRYLRMLEDTERRIHAMAIVHETLYRSETLGVLDINEYIQRLVHAIADSCDGVAGDIWLDIDVDDIYFSLETAIPLGLIINELVTNCMKHAFPEADQGHIRVSLHAAGEDEFELLVADNGVGMEQAPDLENVETLGFDLVRTLTRQLHGTVAIRTEDGTEVRVRIKEVKRKTRA